MYPHKKIWRRRIEKKKLMWKQLLRTLFTEASTYFLPSRIFTVIFVCRYSMKASYSVLLQVAYECTNLFSWHLPRAPSKSSRADRPLVTHTTARSHRLEIVFLFIFSSKISNTGIQHHGRTLKICK